MSEISTRDRGESAEQRDDLARVHRLPTKSAQPPAALKDTQAAPEQAAAQKDEAGEKPGRRWVRPLLFVMLPIALVTGGYYYVEGGQIMSASRPTFRASSRKSMSRRTRRSPRAISSSGSTIFRSASR
jgi:hypothetical protein